MTIKKFRFGMGCTSYGIREEIYPEVFEMPDEEI